MLVAVEPETATEAIMEMQGRMGESHENLSMRAGLASGHVLMVDGEDHIGKAVNLAARLCGLADPGEVLATKEMMTALMVNTPSESVGKRDIDGFAEMVEVVRLEMTSF